MTVRATGVILRPATDPPDPQVSHIDVHDPRPLGPDEVQIVAHDIGEDLLSAPRRIELAPELRARLAPLRRG
jgi:hypothetical protein